MKNTPEFRMWLQVLRQGLCDLVRALDGDLVPGPGEVLDLDELRTWIFEAEGLGSFEWLCDTVDLEVGEARRVIRSYWLRRTGGECIALGIPRIRPNNGKMRVVARRVRVQPRLTRRADRLPEVVDDQAAAAAR
jgi:hypothetical protein